MQQRHQAHHCLKERNKSQPAKGLGAEPQASHPCSDTAGPCIAGLTCDSSAGFILSSQAQNYCCSPPSSQPVCAATTARQISPTSVPHEAVFCTEFSVLLHSLGRGSGALSRLQAGAAAAHVEASVPKSSLWCCEVSPVCPPPLPYGLCYNNNTQCMALSPNQKLF